MPEAFTSRAFGAWESRVSTESGPGSPRGQPAWGGGCDRINSQRGRLIRLATARGSDAIKRSFHDRREATIELSPAFQDRERLARMNVRRLATVENVSVPGAVATGSRGDCRLNTLSTAWGDSSRCALIPSLPLRVLTRSRFHPTLRGACRYRIQWLLPAITLTRMAHLNCIQRMRLHQ